MAEKNCHSEVEQFYLIISCRDSPKIHLNCHIKLTQLLIPWFFGLYPHCLREERKGGKSHCSSLLGSENDWYSLGFEIESSWKGESCNATFICPFLLQKIVPMYYRTDHDYRLRPEKGEMASCVLVFTLRKLCSSTKVRSYQVCGTYSRTLAVARLKRGFLKALVFPTYYYM